MNLKHLSLGFVVCLWACKEQNKPGNSSQKPAQADTVSIPAKDRLPAMSQAPSKIQEGVLELAGKTFRIQGLTEIKYPQVLGEETTHPWAFFYGARANSWYVYAWPFAKASIFHPMKCPYRFPVPGNLIDESSGETISSTQIFTGKVRSKENGFIIFNQFKDLQTQQFRKTCYLFTLDTDTLKYYKLDPEKEKPELYRKKVALVEQKPIQSGK